MKMVDLSNDAFGRWEGILLALGVDPVFLKKTHGPCPFCGGKDREMDLPAVRLRRRV